MKNYFIVFVLFSLLIESKAQLNNFAFEQQVVIDSTREKELYFGFNSLGFFKNNEYSNNIADGFTLFGYQFNPYFSYYPTGNIRIDGGIYLQKDFGIRDFTEIAPTFSVIMDFGNFDLIFGNLQGSYDHRLIEPLYDFENGLNDRLENGIQGLWQTKDIFLDFWVNWETMIFKGDPFQEEISGGTSINYTLLERNKFKLEVPLQMVIYHKGGQIDNSPNPLLSLINTAYGVSFTLKFNNGGMIRSLRSDNYYAYYYDFSNQKQQVFEDGDGIYLNLTAKTRFNLEVMASYWRGDEFITIKGGQLYPSISSSFKNAGSFENNRELFFLRFLYDVKLSENFYLSTRLEPYFDIRNSNMEFSHGLYINYRPDFFLLKNKK